MSILSYLDLVKIVEAGVITNIKPEMINGSSIDISVGNIFYREKNNGRGGIPGGVVKLGNSATERVPPDMEKVILKSDGVLRINPGQCILGQSQQVFNLPPYLSCEVKLKSSTGRSFLNHMLAGWCDPTWNGSVLTMEFKNELEHHYIELPVGTCVAQMIFFKHVSVPPGRDYASRGRYNGDKEVKVMKP